jgi:hypothetical protein
MPLKVCAALQNEPERRNVFAAGRATKLLFENCGGAKVRSMKRGFIKILAQKLATP